MHLSTIKDVFEITGRGCVVVPGIPRNYIGPDKIWRQSPILLKLPDGSEIATHIREIEFVLYAAAQGEDAAFLLPENIKKTDIPMGTEIWTQNGKS